MGTFTAHHRFVHLFILVSFLVFFLAPPLSAQAYYADITIMVDSAGYVTIDGLTNHPTLLATNTEIYTSKQQQLWLLNITKIEIFSEFVYTLTLPEGSSINYIKSTGFIRIEEHQGRLTVIGVGENETLSILLQYTTEKQEPSLLQRNLVYLVFIPAIILVSIILIILVYKEKKHREPPVKEPSLPPQDEYRGLNHRQQQIMILLKEKNTPLTQTDIQRELQIPKASVSRNIRGLERKGLIEKEQIGMSNLIRLKKT